jgi:RNA-directed DNA polymerase
VELLRAILFNCARSGPASQNRDAHPEFRAHLRGRVAWVESIDPGKGARLRRLFERIAW